MTFWLDDETGLSGLSTENGVVVSTEGALAVAPSWVATHVVYTGTAGATDLTVPSTAVAGELLIVVLEMGGANSTSTPLPSMAAYSWTLLDGPTDTATPSRSWAWWRIAGGTSDDHPALLFSGTHYGGLALVRFTGTNPVVASSAVATALAAAGSVNTPAATSTTTDVLDAYVGVDNYAAWPTHTPVRSEVVRTSADGDYLGVIVATEAHPTIGTHASLAFAFTGQDAAMRTFVIANT